MKAAVVNGPLASRPVEVRELPEPTPRPHWVTVRLRHAALNRLDAMQLATRRRRTTPAPSSAPMARARSPGGRGARCRTGFVPRFVGAHPPLALLGASSGRTGSPVRDPRLAHPRHPRAVRHGAGGQHLPQAGPPQLARGRGAPDGRAHCVAGSDDQRPPPARRDRDRRRRLLGCGLSGHPDRGRVRRASHRDHLHRRQGRPRPQAGCRRCRRPDRGRPCRRAEACHRRDRQRGGRPCPRPHRRPVAALRRRSAPRRSTRRRRPDGRCRGPTPRPVGVLEAGGRPGVHDGKSHGLRRTSSTTSP